MPKVDEATHEGRKERVFLALRRYPAGLTEADLEQITSIQRRTLNNYLRTLETEGKILKDGITWLALPYDQVRLRKFDLSPEEGMTLYLATRLLAKQQDKRNEPAETALMKLADVLTADAGVGIEIHQAALELSRRSDDGNYNRIFRTVMQAYIYRHVLHITYEPSRGHPFETDFSPYLLEPSAIGYTTYAIGQSSIVNAWRTYKLERIREAALTRQEYSIPANFPGLDILQSAWSIIYGEELTPVKLRFSPAVRRRVMETRWHPSEDKTDDPDRPDYLLWAAKVADTMDMLPWIRGWGADVEVLEPRELREALMAESRRLARLYGVASPAQDPAPARVLRCWGKTGKTPQDFHPAMFHMLDVGHVAQELLSDRASPRWRRVLADALNADPDTLSDWLPWVVAMHDIGKISAAFQSLNKDQSARLKQEGFLLVSQDVPHPFITQIHLAGTLLRATGVMPTRLTKTVSEALGGHHGRYPHPDNDIKPARRYVDSEPAEWQTLRQQADSMLREALLKRDVAQLPDPTNLSAAIMAITGFTILCDWLGSDARYFQPAPEAELGEYTEQSQSRAERATRESGLLALTASPAPADAALLFDDLGQLRPLQLAINDIPRDLLRSPSLAVIEAPTGEGKTEAALALAHRIAQITGTEELYYALPTMATSNQMFARLQVHLQQRLELAASVKLVHGQSFLIEDELRLETPAAFVQPLENGGVADQSQSDEAVAWFNSKKRALLAPFGVGTIDQAELAALNVKHAALRMMGLAGKVVIVDEVHAYDTYMTTVIERLLRWLATMNASVILLSATLPQSRREQLVKAYCPHLELKEDQANAYPSLLVLSEKGSHQASPQVWQPNRVLELSELHFGDDDAQTQAKAEWLLNAVVNGGCACWMTNTVKRAQRIFAELLKIAPPDVDLSLLHSQFTLDERQRRETKLAGIYGQNGNRPERGIVVGTQVLEQSLDLDFDVMASDLAPIDLLLQRAGRLHRHARPRPAAHDAPRLWVNYELTPEGNLKPGSDRTIYAEFVMRQTQQTLAGRRQIHLPADYRTLIEAVYTDQPPLEDSPLYDAWMDLQSGQQMDFKQAKERLLPAPSASQSFAVIAATKPEYEENENSSDWFVAQTRLGEETLNVIPIERDGDWARAGSADEKIAVTQEAPREAQRKLLRRNLRVSRRDAIDAIREDREEKPTRLFKKSSLLKNYYPLWLTNGKAQFKIKDGALRITLDPQLGLVIEKEGKPNDTTE